MEPLKKGEGLKRWGLGLGKIFKGVPKGDGEVLGVRMFV